MLHETPKGKIYEAVWMAVGAIYRNKLNENRAHASTISDCFMRAFECLNVIGLYMPLLPWLPLCKRHSGLQCMWSSCSSGRTGCSHPQDNQAMWTLPTTSQHLPTECNNFYKTALWCSDGDTMVLEQGTRDHAKLCIESQLKGNEL